MNIEWREIWSYFIGFLGMIYDTLPHTCEGVTTLFAMLIVIVTFFFITIPTALEKAQRKRGGE